jgi:hypothetical protein
MHYRQQQRKINKRLPLRHRGVLCALDNILHDASCNTSATMQPDTISVGVAETACAEHSPTGRRSTYCNEPRLCYGTECRLISKDPWAPLCKFL